MVGTEGNRLAEDYIYDYYKKLGLKSPSGIKDYKQYYKQDVILLEEKMNARYQVHDLIPGIFCYT